MGFMLGSEVQDEVLSKIGNRPVEALATTAGDTNGGTDRLNRYINQAQIELCQLRMEDGRVVYHRELEETNSQPLVGNTPSVSTWPARAYSTTPLLVPATPAGAFVDATNTPTLAIQSVRIYNPSGISRGWRLDPIRDREEFERQIQLPSLPRYYGVFAPRLIDWPSSTPALAYTFDKSVILLCPPPILTYDGWALEIRRRRYPKLLARVQSAIVAGVWPWATLDNTSKLELGAQWDECIVLGAAWRVAESLNLYQMRDALATKWQQVSMDVARRHQADAEDLDYGPPVEMPYYQMPF